MKRNGGRPYFGLHVSMLFMVDEELVEVLELILYWKAEVRSDKAASYGDSSTRLISLAFAANS